MLRLNLYLPGTFLNGVKLPPSFENQALICQVKYFSEVYNLGDHSPILLVFASENYKYYQIIPIEYPKLHKCLLKQTYVSPTIYTTLLVVISRK